MATQHPRVMASATDALEGMLDSLIGYAGLALRNAIASTVLECKHYRKMPHEPDFMAALMLRGVAEFAPRWVEHFQQTGHELSILSVFCHQRPIVKWPASPKGCELGDLLVMVRHHEPARTCQSALLLQAKCIQPDWNHSGEPQLELYRSWPAFRYASPLRHEERDVLPKSVHGGAEYLVLFGPPFACDDYFQRRRPRPLQWPQELWRAPLWVMPPADLGHSPRHLPIVLAEMLTLSAGRVIVPRGKDDAWSEVIWDILDMSLEKVFDRQRSGVMARPRVAQHGRASNAVAQLEALTVGWKSPSASMSLITGSGSRSAQQAASLFVSRAVPPEGPLPEGPAEEEFGMSLLLIEVGAGNEP